VFLYELLKFKKEHFLILVHSDVYQYHFCSHVICSPLNTLITLAHVLHIPQGDIQRIWKGSAAVMYRRVFAERILNWLIFT